MVLKDNSTFLFSASKIRRQLTNLPFQEASSHLYCRFIIMASILFCLIVCIINRQDHQLPRRRLGRAKIHRLPFLTTSPRTLALMSAALKAVDAFTLYQHWALTRFGQAKRTAKVMIDTWQL
jgi:hypothetical protein